MVTRILFDPRTDNPDGTQAVLGAVTIEATPTGIREDGSVFILPSTLTFSMSQQILLSAPTASFAWRLAVYNAGQLRQTRVVRFPDVASITWAALTDVDPTSLGNTPGHARQWDATFAQLVQLIGAGGSSYLPLWKANTAYSIGTFVVSPTGQIIQANTTFTSGATYNATNWTVVAGGGGGTVSDATTTTKGVVQLAGDLGGTAAAPTVPGLAAKAPLASPTFIGTPAVPTATAGTTTTQAASTAFVAAALSTLIGGAGGAYDTLGELQAILQTDESAAAALASLIAQRTVSAAPVTLTAAGTLTPNVQNLLDATTGPFTATLPTPARIGQLLVVERADATTNLISIGGTVRGATTGLPTLPGLGVAGEAITFAAESLTSWRPIASHKPKGLLDKQFASAPFLGVDGNYHLTGA